MICQTNHLNEMKILLCGFVLPFFIHLAPFLHVLHPQWMQKKSVVVFEVVFEGLPNRQTKHIAITPEGRGCWQRGGLLSMQMRFFTICVWLEKSNIGQSLSMTIDNTTDYKSSSTIHWTKDPDNNNWRLWGRKSHLLISGGVKESSWVRIRQPGLDLIITPISPKRW